MMNDTEFENILKQALRPDISDEEILIKETPSRSKRRKSTMRKHRIIQSAIAAAACFKMFSNSVSFIIRQPPISF